jgi:hypothetical protein
MNIIAARRALCSISSSQARKHLQRARLRAFGTSRPKAPARQAASASGRMSSGCG